MSRTPGLVVSLISLAAKLTRSTSAPLLIHSVPSCQPSTEGGLSRVCPMKPVRSEVGMMSHVGTGDASAEPHRAGDEFGGAFDSRVLRLFEEVGVEEDAQHVAYLVVAVEISLC